MRKLFLTLLVCCLSVNVSVGQDTKDKMEKKQDSELEDRIEMMSTIMLQMFGRVGLDDEQKQKIEAIIGKYVPKLITSREMSDKLLDKEQMRLFNKARSLAQKAGYDDDKADDYALKKLKLDKEQAAQFKKAKNEVLELNNNLNSEIAAVMTDEQKQKLPMFKDMVKKEGSDAKGSAAKADGSKKKVEGSTNNSGN